MKRVLVDGHVQGLFGQVDFAHIDVVLYDGFKLNCVKKVNLITLEHLFETRYSGIGILRKFTVHRQCMLF